MKLGRRAFVLGCACCAAVGRAQAVSLADDVPPLSVTRLADNVWRHTSWRRLANGRPFSSNGLIVGGARAGLIVDTTWGAGEMANLVRIARDATGGLPLSLACTHAHDDRMSGVSIARDNGVRSLAHFYTQQDATARGLPPVDETWRGRRTHIDLGGRGVELYYPGPAHTRDNVTAFDAESGVLFGGCQIRAGDDANLGNLADAVVSAWPTSTRRLIQRYRDRARIVVPGHGEPGGPELLDHTLALAKAAVARAG